MRVVGLRTLTVILALLALESWAYHGEKLGRWTVMEKNARLGWRMLPWQDAWSRHLDVREFINGGPFDPMGFRDRDWGDPGDAGPDFRVAIVGNSISYGSGVPIEETFGRVLEDRLGAHLRERGDPRRAIVMNFAVQGYVFEQMARVYEDVIRPWRPDVLVVPHHPHDIAPMEEGADDPEYAFRRWVIRTATYDLLNRHVINRWIPPVPTPPAARAKHRAWVELEESIRNRPFGGEHGAWWEAYFRRLDGVRETVEADGGRLALVALPRWREHLNPNMPRSDTRVGPYANLRGVPIARPADAYAAAMAPVIAEIERERLDVSGTIDLRARLRALGAELETIDRSCYLPYDVGHYSARGHAIIGDALFETLRAAGLP